VVIVSLIGGFYPAFAAAIAGSLLLNYYFVPPIHTFTIASGDNLLALFVFVVIAILVSRVVDVAARRTVEAARSNAEAETLSTLAGSVLRGEQALPAMLQRVQETFAVRSVSLLRRDTGAPASVGAAPNTRATGGLRGTWSCVASVGEDPCLRPEDGDTEAPAGSDLTLVLRGRTLAAEDQRVLTAFAAQVAVAYQQRRLAAAADSAGTAGDVNRNRAGLLNAVRHDMNPPIAAAKAAVSSLRSPDSDRSRHDERELLASADAALDQLTELDAKLVDLSRLQAGLLSVNAYPIGVDAVVNRALQDVADAREVDLDVPGALPEVLADPGLLGRALADLIENAFCYAPADKPVRLAATAHGATVEIRVIDRGPGILQADRDAAFLPFQRYDDNGAGPGVGLAVADGLLQSMNGTLRFEDTPGGGLTAVVGLPIAR